MNLLIQLKKATPVFLVALACFGLLPTTQAVVPAPDGGYPGGQHGGRAKRPLSLTSGGTIPQLVVFSLCGTLRQFNTGGRRWGAPCLTPQTTIPPLARERF